MHHSKYKSELCYDKCKASFVVLLFFFVGERGGRDGVGYENNGPIFLTMFIFYFIKSYAT